MLRLALPLALLLALFCSNLSALSAQVSQASTVFDPAVKAASELPRLHSLLVSRRGEVILERYFTGRRATTPANVKSVSKSLISALVGIASDRKLLDLKQPIGRYFPDMLSAPADAPKRAITIEDLLTMQIGARVDEQSKLRRVGPERELGPSRARKAALSCSRVRR